MKTKNNNGSSLNGNETTIFPEQYYRDLRQKYGVELSGLQQGFYHIFYNNKQFIVNQNMNLNYNPQYGIYTGFSLLVLLLILVVIVSYYQIKQKIRAFFQLYVFRRKNSRRIQSFHSNNSSKRITSTNDLTHMVVSSQATELQFIRTLSDSDSLLESTQIKTGEYHLTPYGDNRNQYSVSAHNVNDMRSSWNNLSIPSATCAGPSDFDSLSIRTAVEFTNPGVFSMNATTS